MDRLTARYLIETPLILEKAAAVIAGEQSSGTFVDVPGDTEELRAQFAARVEAVEPLEAAESPSLPGSRRGDRYARGIVTISWPIENFGPNLPALISTLQGNLYELSQISGLRLLDFDPPPSLTAHFSGPKFGVPGTRQLAGVADRPLIGTIIKPSVGLSPDHTAQFVAELCAAGIDFIKDDELMANPPHSPFADRVRAVMRVLNEHADRTGKRIMFAFNVSDELDAMLQHYDDIVAAGGTCAMISINSVGVAAAKKVCDRGQLTIHAHRNGWGMLTRHPAIGVEFPAYQKLWRMVGVDQVHVNGIDNKFWEPDDTVVQSIQACQKAVRDLQPLMPVVSSGQWGGQAFETYRRTRTVDLLYLAGGGIAAHPAGAAGGVKAIRDAWQAATAGETLEQACRQSLELRMAVEKFGRRGEMNVTTPQLSVDPV